MSWKEIQLSLLLDGYERKENRTKEIDKILKENGLHITNYISPLQNVNQTSIQKQESRQEIKIDIDVKTELPAIQSDFENLKDILVKANPNLEKNLNEIGDCLNEVSSNTANEKMNKPFNKLRKFLEKLADENSDYHKIISGSEK